MHLFKAISGGINRVLAPIGLKIARASHDWGDVSAYIPFHETMSKAKESGLALGDYIDSRQGITGATQATIRGMKELGVFDGSIRAIVEVGPGTGRYLDCTLQECSPERYEIYETASEWADFVSKKYRVVRQPTDGHSLRATATASIDLAQAHKVFSAVTFVTTARYWCEMARVVRDGGYIVFDVMTERCLTPQAVEEWVHSGIPSRSSYPAVIPSSTVIDFFNSRQFEQIGSFLTSMPPGQTEVFVLKKSYHSQTSGIDVGPPGYQL
jgi:hypothetical protein